jgi:5'-deoxynucleotidase YfbR-like HD superfamily hydrolase
VYVSLKEYREEASPMLTHKYLPTNSVARCVSLYCALSHDIGEWIIQDPTEKHTVNFSLFKKMLLKHVNEARENTRDCH